METFSELPLWGESTGPWWIPSQRLVTHSFDLFFDVRLNIRFKTVEVAGDLGRHDPYDAIVMYS